MSQETIRTTQLLFAILILLALAVSLAGTGCTDLGSATAGGDDDDSTGTVDSVSFAMDVLPIFVDNCAGSGCHVNSFAPALGLDLSDYDAVIDGSNSGAVVIPGNAQDSELIKRLEARSLPSMPDGRAMLDTEVIAVIREWIDDGALDN